jgi:Type IIA topoisomerase (DNA gyrase/topo II, topoisomerase IV), B subunit
MNPAQLRVTTMDPDTRRLVQLVLDDSTESAGTDEVMDKLLGKKRAQDRKRWLEASGHLADIA